MDALDRLMQDRSGKFARYATVFHTGSDLFETIDGLAFSLQCPSKPSALWDKTYSTTIIFYLLTT